MTWQTGGRKDPHLLQLHDALHDAADGGERPQAGHPHLPQSRLQAETEQGADAAQTRDEAADVASVDAQRRQV